jgi:hypothetical protein
MGLANAPSQFQRLMDLLMVGLLWEACLVYLDDVIVFSSTFENRLAAVFQNVQVSTLQVTSEVFGTSHFSEWHRR